MSAMYTTKKQTKKSSKKPLIIIILIILLIAAIGFWIWNKNNSPPTNATVPTNTGTPATANPDVPGGTDENPSTGGGGSKDEGSNTPGTAPDSSVTPATPSGQFVSNHEPNLSGSPAPNTETSACTTTPGVLCKITFTSGSVVKSLPAQRTDSNGNTLWTNWTLQSVGLTKGSWQIAAVATNGSKSASVQDSSPLVVTQ
ncbi:MAG TPA: hypothetical protein VLG47_02010 [Candidatus Saccharimonadales bacterium]|nr:hypothetical protein [Candidatus Saccharimonadales bacterium]